MSKKIHILFLCVANSARSQLAEGLAKELFGNSALIESAGSKPSGFVQPWAIQSLKEIGIEISHHQSKSIDDLGSDFLDRLDYVITLCEEEVCPVILTKAKKLHWPIKDPAHATEENKPDAFRTARNEIKEKLETFKKQICC